MFNIETSKFLYACCVLHKFCQLVGEAPPSGRPNVNVDPHDGLLRHKHPHKRGMGQDWWEKP